MPLLRYNSHSEFVRDSISCSLIVLNIQAGNRFLIVNCGGGTTVSAVAIPLRMYPGLIFNKDVTAIEITDTGMGRNFTNLSSSIGVVALSNLNLRSGC